MTKVYLAVGHGDRDNGTFDPGAVGGGWTEQTAGDIVVAEAAKLLRGAGLDVRDEANRDDPNFPGTTRQANAWGADLLVSVHHDWVGAPEGAFGHWVSDAGKEAADHIQRTVGSAGFPLRPSWHKRRTDLYVLNNTDMPAVLYECGKIGQEGLDTVEELEQMGHAIAAGIVDWAGVKPPDVEVEVTAEEVRQIVREELQVAFSGRDYGNDVSRLRRSVRAVAGKLGLETEYLVPEDYEVDA